MCNSILTKRYSHKDFAIDETALSALVHTSALGSVVFFLEVCSSGILLSVKYQKPVHRLEFHLKFDVLRFCCVVFAR